MNPVATVRRVGLLFVIQLLCEMAWPAAAQHFSVNQVGYVDLQFQAGSNLVSNPLNARDNTIGSLFRGIPDGSFFLPWLPGGAWFPATNSFHIQTGWTDPAAKLVSPNGGFLCVPSPVKLSFAGEPWRGGCVTYPSGMFVSSIMPLIACGFCDNFNGNCPPAIPDGTTANLWDARYQQWLSWEYDAFFYGGWVSMPWGIPADPPALAPGQAALFYGYQSYSARYPLVGEPLTDWTASPLGWRRDGADVSFLFSATNGPCVFLYATNLNQNTWLVVDPQAYATISNGVASLRVDLVDKTAFFRLHPPYTPGVVSLERASRNGNSFQFEFHAEQLQNYIVQRADKSDAASWQEVGRVSVSGANAVITFTDSAAFGPEAYYRVQF